MSDRQKILERIRKLLALSERNTNSAEATQAVLFAQRLIVLYNVEDAELKKDSIQDENIVSVNSQIISNPRLWRVYLRNLVAASFRCKSWETVEETYSPCGQRKTHNQATFYGYEQDAQAATLAFEYLYRTGNRLANAKMKSLRKERRSTKGAYNSYIAGYLSGLTHELEKQSKELMIVLPLAVKDKFDAEIAPAIKTGSARQLSCDRRRQHLINEGYRDGIKTVCARRIEKESQ